MPIYEYQCSACGERCEKFEKISDAPATDCPSCGKTNLSRMVSAPSFQLKGTGWYVTDFRDKDKPKPAANTSGTSEKKSEPTSAETKTEATPKTEAKKDTGNKDT